MSDGRLWDGVDQMVDRAPSLEDLRAHRLQLLAARRWRALGQPVPVSLCDEERVSAIFGMAAQIVLEKARSAIEGPVVVFKGPVLAGLYPDPVLRPFRDLDLLVRDAETAQAALLAAGFVPIGNEDEYYLERHHLRPLRWPKLPLVVEVHRRPEWPKWSRPPSAEEIIGGSEPADVGVPGLLAPSRVHHALLVAAHSWSEVPLRRALDLVDVSALSQGLDPEEIRQLATEWDVRGVWDTTKAAADALLFDGPTPLSLKLWARDLRDVRDRTVFANHVRHVASSFWGLPLPRAIPVAGRRVLRAARPEAGETWRGKSSRAGLALKNAFTRLSEHNSELERREDRSR